MEEAAVAVTQTLTRLIWPIGLLAIGIGVLTMVFARLPRRRRENAKGEILLPRSSAVEAVVVGFCGAISFIALVVAIQTLRVRGPSLSGYWSLSVLLVVAAMVMGLPAILWKTRLRWAAEGVASIALAVVAALSGFSIGFFFVPLLVLMIWVCIQHLRDADSLRRARGGTAA